jgi:uncharacterized membrane protein YdjX (TVP38/TMEM64 family)
VDSSQVNGQDGPVSQTPPAAETTNQAGMGRAGRFLLAPALIVLSAAVGLGLLVVAGVDVRGQAAALWALVTDAQALETWVASLGWMGPLALIGFNALQIVVAPIPGYVVQLAAGYLFGPIWGGVWGAIGLLLGSSIAFWLARVYGRPVAELLVGASRLERWEKVSHSTSTLVWFILLLGPTGDAPFFLAGLSKVPFLKVLIITSIIRVPSTFVAAAAGAGIMIFSPWQLALIFVGLASIVVVFIRYQTAIMAWTDRQMHRRLAPKLAPPERLGAEDAGD